MPLPFSSERLLGTDSVGWTQSARPCACRCPADPATQHQLPLPVGVRKQHPTQEHGMGGIPSWSSTLLAACIGRSAPHARVPRPIFIPLHFFHDSVKWPPTQGGAPLPRGGLRRIFPSWSFTLDERRWQHGLGLLRMPESLLRQQARGLLRSYGSWILCPQILLGVLVQSELDFQLKPQFCPVLIDNGIRVCSYPL